MAKSVREYWLGKKNQAKTRGIEFKLTISDIENMLSEAGITASDIGRSSDEYCLARKCILTGDVDGDLPYSRHTCRFVTNRQNKNEFDWETNRKDIKEAMSTPEVRERISNATKGKMVSEETRQKMSESKTGDKNHFFGKTHSEETKIKLREARAKQGSPTKGKKLKLKTCPHCGKVGGGANMTRYHFDNCKEKDV